MGMHMASMTSDGTLVKLIMTDEIDESSSLQVCE